MDVIPNECLFVVLDSLTVAERVKAERTCKRWLGVINNLFEKQTVLVLGKPTESTIEYIETRCRTERHWYKRTDIVARLPLSDHLSDTIATTVVKRCPNLEALYIYTDSLVSAKNLIMELKKSCQKLEHLHVTKDALLSFKLRFRPEKLTCLAATAFSSAYSSFQSVTDTKFTKTLASLVADCNGLKYFATSSYKAVFINALRQPKRLEKLVARQRSLETTRVGEMKKMCNLKSLVMPRVPLLINEVDLGNLEELSYCNTAAKYAPISVYRQAPTAAKLKFFCPGHDVSPADIKYISRMAPNLEKFRCSLGQGFSSLSVVDVLKLIEGFPHLTDLFLATCDVFLFKTWEDALKVGGTHWTCTTFKGYERFTSVRIKFRRKPRAANA